MGSEFSNSNGILDKINDGWQNILEVLSEKGIPLKSVADELEQRGIPSLPVFLILILLLIGLVGFFVIPNLFTVQNGTVSVSVTDSNENPVSNVQVTLSSTSATPLFNPITLTSDSNGFANFTNVPIGPVSAIISSPDYQTSSNNGQSLAGQTSQLLLSATTVALTNVNLYLTISGPTDPSTVTATLEDQYFNVLNTSTGLNPTFSIPENTIYQLKVNANGFSEYDLNGQNSSTSDQSFNVILNPLSGAQQGLLHSFIYQIQNSTQQPIANATVQIIDANTQNILFNVTAGSDGTISPVTLPVGDLIKIRASAFGFSTKTSKAITISSGNLNEEDLQLIPLNGIVSTLSVNVLDSFGNPAQNPVITLYDSSNNYQIVKQDQPFSGTDSFILEPNTKYSLGVYLLGNLPQFFSNVVGGSMTVSMVASNGTNSATANFEVLNPDTTPSDGASILIENSNGTPFGFPSIVTGPDGTQQQSDLPSGTQLLLTASNNGRVGYLVVNLASNNNTYTIQLSKADATVQVTTTDVFSGSPIANVNVTIGNLANGGGFCITGLAGNCTAYVLESTGTTATAISSNYQPFVSSSFSIAPNTVTPLSVQLISSSVQANSQPIFEGFYNSNGQKVSSLLPSSSYTAKFLVQSPPIGFSNAQLFVYEGSESSSLSKDPATITSYSAPLTQQIIGGTDFSSASTFTSAPSSYLSNQTGLNLTNSSALPYYQNPVSASSSPISEAGNGVANAANYKWVSFEFPSFTGAAQASVNFQTNQVTNGTVVFNYRSAYYADNQIVRSPPDSQAGITESDLFAKTFLQSINIGFGGVCNNDACVSLYTQLSYGNSYSQNIQASVGQSFNLDFNVLTNETLTANIQTSGIELGVLSGESGQNSAAVNNQSNGASSASVGLNGADGSFIVRGQRVSNDASLHFTLTNSNGAVVFDKTIFVKVNSFENPSLIVSTLPNSLVALSSTNLQFNITDSLGLPINNAFISIGTLSDALGQTLQAQPISNSNPGEYVSNGLQATSVGQIDYTINVAGFQTYSGSIPVVSNSLLSLQATKLNLQVDSLTSPANASFTITNPLNNQLQVSSFVVRTSLGSYLQYSTIPTNGFTVAPNSQVTFSLVASTNPTLMAYSSNPINFSENDVGYLELKAQAGSSSQTLQIPFSASLNVAQQNIDSAISANPSSLNIVLSPPSSLNSSQQISLTNTGADPILINQQLSGNLGNAFVLPLSAQINPGQTQQFTVYASSQTQYSSTDCIFDSTNLTGTLSLYPSFQGVFGSQINVPVSIDTQPSSICAPSNPLSVNLPVSLVFNVPQNSKVRNNTDNTVSMQLSDGNIIVFGTGSTYSNNQVTIPAGDQLTLDSKFISSDTSLNTTVTIPTSYYAVIPTSLSIVNWKTGNFLEFPYMNMSLPSVISYSVDQSGQKLVYIPANNPISISPLSASNTSNDNPITLPANVIFQFPANSVKASTGDGGFTIILQDGSAFGFAADSSVASSNPDGSISISSPQLSTVLMPQQDSSLTSSTDFSYVLPFASSIQLSPSDSVIYSSTNTIVHLQDYDLLLPNTATFEQNGNYQVTNLTANSKVTFISITGQSLSSDTYASLPVSISITLPSIARIQSNSLGYNVYLSNSDVMGLPINSIISPPSLDGSVNVVIPANSQSAWPNGWLTPLQLGGWNLSIPIPYSFEFPIATPVVQKFSSLDIQLPSYDLLVPLNTTVSTLNSSSFSQTSVIYSNSQINPAEQLNVTGNVNVILPFDSSFNVPIGSRLESTSNSIKLLLPTGQVIGFDSQAVLSPDYSSIFVPSSSIVTFPNSFANVTSSQTTITLPFTSTFQLPLSSSVFRRSTLQLVTSSYIANFPLSSSIQSNANNVELNVSSSSRISIQSTNFSVIGQSITLPIQLSFAISPNTVSKQLQDGSIFVDFSSARADFGLGSTLINYQLTVPSLTTSSVSSGIFSPAYLPFSTSSSDGYHFVLPVAYVWTISPGMYSQIQKDGDGTYSLATNTQLIIFPDSVTTNYNQSSPTSSITMSLPAYASTTVYSINAGELTSQERQALSLSATQGVLTTLQNIQALSATNVVVIPEFNWDFTIKPPIYVSSAGLSAGVVAIPISSNSVIVFPQTVQVTTDNLSGATNILIPAGTQVSLPRQISGSISNGGWYAQIPFSTTVSVPSDSQIVTDPTDFAAQLSGFSQEVIVPSNSPFNSPSGASITSNLNPGEKVIQQPSGSYSTNGDVGVILPAEFLLNFGSNVRLNTQGTFTSVRFADSSVGQIPGTITILPNNQGEQIDWQSNSQAYLPSSMAKLDSTSGAVNLTLPIPITILLPISSQISNQGNFKAVFNNEIITSSQPATISTGTSSYSVSIPANSKIFAGPLSLNVNGPTISLPFSLTVYLPSGAITQNNLQGGGVAVEFSGGYLIDFKGSSTLLAPQNNLLSLSGYSSYSPLGGSLLYPSSILGAQNLLNPSNNYQSSSSSYVNVPANSPITLSPSLITQNFNSIGQSPYLSNSYTFSIPSSIQINYPNSLNAYFNPDGTVSIYSTSRQITLPFGTAQSVNSFSNIQNSNTLSIPANGQISVNPIFNGMFYGQSVSLPFDLLLLLPVTSRIYPVANDGTQTIDFGNGQRMVLSHPLQLSNKVTGEGLVSSTTQVDVPSGTNIVFSQGLLNKLPASVMGQVDVTNLNPNTNAFGLTLPIQSSVLVPSNNRIYTNPDGGQSVYLSNYEVRVANSGTSPIPQSGGAVTSLMVNPQQTIMIIPLQFALPANNFLVLPLDATFLLSSNDRVLPPANDGSRTVEFGPDTSITFGAGVTGLDVSIPIAKLPQGTEFSPSPNLVQTTSNSQIAGSSTITTQTLTLPVNTVFSIPNNGQLTQNSDGSYSYIAGTIEIDFPANSVKSQSNIGITTGSSGIPLTTITVNTGNKITISPVDSSVSNTQQLSLPVDLKLNLDSSTKVFPAAVDGTTVIKFSSNSAFVVNSPVIGQTSSNPGSIDITAQSPFSVSNSLVMLAKITGGAQTDGLSNSATPSSASIKLLIPVASTITTSNSDSYSFDSTNKEYVIITPTSMVLLSKGANIVATNSQTSSVSFNLVKNSVIEIQPLDLSTQGLSSIPLLPEQILLLLPNSANFYSSSGFNSNKYATFSSKGVNYKFVMDPSTVSFNSQLGKVIIPPINHNLLAPKGSYLSSQPNSFSLTFPTSWAITYNPSKDKISKSKIPGFNTLTFSNGLSMDFPASITPQSASAILPVGTISSSSLSAFNPPSTLDFQSAVASPSATNFAASTEVLVIPAYAKITFNTLNFDLINTAGGNVGSLSFTIPINAQTIISSAGASINHYSNKVVVTYSSCNQLSLTDSSGNPYFQSMQIVQAIFSDASINSQSLNSNIININPNSKMTLRTCPTPNSLVYTQYNLNSGQTIVVLPTDSDTSSGNSAKFPTCRQLNFFGSSSVVPSTGVSQINFGSIPTDAVLHSPSLDLNLQPASPVPNSANSLASIPSTIPKGFNKPYAVISEHSPLTITLCSNPLENSNLQAYSSSLAGSSGGPSLSGSGPQLFSTSTPSLTYTFDDGTLSIPSENAPVITLNNNGVNDITLSNASVVASNEIANFLDPSRIKWGLVFQSGTQIIIINPKTPTTTLQIPGSVPANYLTVDQKCILSPNTFTGNVEITGNDNKDNIQYIVKIPVTIILDSTGITCTSLHNFQNTNLISSFYSTHAYSVNGNTYSPFGNTIYFKGPNQHRYFELINNLPNSIILSAKFDSLNPNPVVSCKVQQGSSPIKLINLKGYVLSSASNALVNCTSNPIPTPSSTSSSTSQYFNSQLTITSQSVDSNGKAVSGSEENSIIEQFSVYNLSANERNFYNSSPWGSLLDSSGLTGLTPPSGSNADSQLSQSAPSSANIDELAPPPSPTVLAPGTTSPTSPSSSPNPSNGNVAPSQSSFNDFGVSPGYYSACQNAFCNSIQIKNALLENLAVFIGSVNNSIPINPQVTDVSFQVNQLRDEYKNSNDTISKSFVIQKAGSLNINSIDLNNFFSSFFNPNQVQVNQGPTSLSTCGIYSVKISTNLLEPGFAKASTGRDAYLSNLAYIVTIKQDSTCTNTVANSLILMGDDQIQSLPSSTNAPTTSYGFFTGKRVVTSASSEFGYALKKIRSNFPIGAIGSYSLGVYSNDPSVADKLLGTTFVNLFNNNLFEPTASLPIDYNNAGFCFINSAKTLPALSIAATGFAAISFGISAATGGGVVLSDFATYFGLKIALAAKQAFVGCGFSTLGVSLSQAYSKVEQGSKYGPACQSIDLCISQILVSTFSILNPSSSSSLPGIKSSLGSIFNGKSLLISGVLITAISGISSSIYSPETQSATIPLGQLSRGAPSAIVYSLSSSRILSKSSVPIPPSTFPSSTSLVTPQVTTYPPGFLNSVKDILSKFDPENPVPTITDLKNLKSTCSATCPAQEIDIDSLIKVVSSTDSKRSQTIINELLNKLAETGPIAETSPIVKTGLLSSLNNFRNGIKGKASSVGSIIKNNLGTGLGIIAALATRVDEQPNAAFLSPALPNHVVIEHLEPSEFSLIGVGTLLGTTNYVPTIYYNCLLNSDVTNPNVNTATDCNPNYSFYLANICNSDQSVCVRLLPVNTLSNISPFSQEYILYLSVNNQNYLNNANLLPSLFVNTNNNKIPISPITLHSPTDTLVTSIITSGDISGIYQKVHDNGKSKQVIIVNPTNSQVTSSSSNSIPLYSPASNSPYPAGASSLPINNNAQTS